MKEILRKDTFISFSSSYWFATRWLLVDRGVRIGWGKRQPWSQRGKGAAGPSPVKRRKSILDMEGREEGGHSFLFLSSVHARDTVPFLAKLESTDPLLPLVTIHLQFLHLIRTPHPLVRSCLTSSDISTRCFTNCLLIALMIEAVRTSETSIYFYLSIQF
jgi:hypothetical protein